MVKFLKTALVSLYSIFIAFIPVYVFGANPTDKNNPWDSFYEGDIDAAMQIAKRVFTENSQVSEKIDAAVAWMLFCNYSSDPYCTEEPSQYLSYLSTGDNNLSDERSKRWAKTELQNSMVPMFLQYERGREVFRTGRFEHINYFSVGDGRLNNYLNAQKSLAFAAREEFETVFAREVVTRLIYRLGELHETGASDKPNAWCLLR